MTTEIQRTASEIARAIRFMNRMDRAEAEARRQDEAKGMTTHVKGGAAFTLVIARANMKADIRKEALEASLSTMEPETLADTLVLAAWTLAAFDLFVHGEAPSDADRQRVEYLIGAMVRGLEKHCEPTPDIETILGHYANTHRQPWFASEAEAECVANVLLPVKPDGMAGLPIPAEATE